MNNGKFTYKESWWKMIKDQSPKVRLEVMDAIVSYAFSGEDPPMGLLARGIFSGIKLELDGEKIKKHRISQKRAEAGKKHKGNQHKKLEQMEQVFQNDCISASSEQMFQTEQNGTNGIIVPKVLKINEFGTSVPEALNNIINNINNNINIKNNNYEENKIINNNNYAYACEKMLEWLGDNEEQLMIVCKRNRLIVRAEPKEKMLEILQPYAEEFVQNEAVREDIGRGMYREVKQHFENWLRYIIQKQQDNDRENRESGNGTGSCTQENADYWDI